MPRGKKIRDNTPSFGADSSVLGSATKLLISEADLDTVLRTVLEQAVETTSAMRGFLAIVDHDRGDLAVRYTVGENWDEHKRQMRLKVSEKTGRGITSHVAATGKSYISGDVNNDPYYIQFFEDVKSELAVPLVDADQRVWGVINIESRQYNAFDKGHQEMVEALASVGSAAITISHHRARETALVDIGKDLTEILDVPALLQRVIDVTAEALRFEDCSIFLIDQAAGELTLRASRGSLAERVDRASYRLGEGLTGWVASEGNTIRTTDPRRDPRWRGLHAEYPPEEVGAFMAVPIIGRDRTLGVLRVLRKKSPYPWFPNDFTPDDERILTIIGSQVGVALENTFLVDRLLNAQRMAAWGEMSARSAHMIGNRLFAIKGDLNELEYMLSGDSPDVAAGLELLASTKKGIFSLEEILGEFREFVMATHLNLEESDLGDLLRESASEGFPKRSPVRLVLDIAESMPKIQADRGKLKRCFSELMENSINFQPEGGELVVSSDVADDKMLKEIPNAPRSGKFLQVIFRDNGPGIPEENKARIFTPFFTTRSKGMGLGLSIVKGIIEAHRGFILETGEPEEGANFTILLPYNGGKSDTHSG